MRRCRTLERKFLTRGAFQTFDSRGWAVTLAGMGTMSRSSSVSASVRERRRVAQHLFGAERMVAAGHVRPDSLQALNRALLLDELRRYRRRGRFPLNHDFRARPTPLFIDSHGTRCAVAHLMEISGFGALVKHIAATDNAARVRELVRLAEVRAWLAAAGLSSSEAARIQPGYEETCDITEAEACFCGSSPLSNLALGTIVSSSGESIEIRVERIGGDWPGLMVGDQLSVEFTSGEVNKRALVTQDAEAGGIPVVLGGVARVASNLSIFGDQAWCQLNGRTAERPVSVDVVFEALLTDRSSCVEAFASVDSRWSQSQCPDESDSESSCGFTHGDASPGVIEFTSAAILAALVAYRRKRRR